MAQIITFPERLEKRANEAGAATPRAAGQTATILIFDGVWHETIEDVPPLCPDFDDPQPQRKRARGRF